MRLSLMPETFTMFISASDVSRKGVIHSSIGDRGSARKSGEL